MAMSREEFMRQMGISKDDVADPEVVVASKREEKQSAQSSYFASKVTSKKVFPGYASATPPAPQQQLSEEGTLKYENYVNRRVNNVTNGKVDDQDEPYMPTSKTSQPQQGNNEVERRDVERPARRESRIKDDWIADEPVEKTSNKVAPVADDTEALYTRNKNSEGLSVAQRIAQASLQFYGAGDSDGEETITKSKPLPSVPAGQPTDARSRAEFLKSLGIDNTEDYVAKSKGNNASAGALNSLSSLTGANRTEALSNAVAARRMQRKAAQVAKANTEEEPAYIPPRSAPTALPEVPAPSKYLPAANDAPRASSEPSGDQQRVPRTQARVTINEQSNSYRRPEVESYRHEEVESPKKIVNDLLFGASTVPRAAPTSNATYGATNTPAPRPAYTSTSSRNDDSTSSLNTIGKFSATQGNSAEYDPETADMSPEELKMLGNKSFENGDFRKAVRYYTKAINKDPSNPALYSNRSAAYLQASKQMGMDTRSMALRDAEKTIELNPKWFKGYSRKGDTLFKMERYDDAIEAYEKGLQFDEGNPSLIHSIGEARNANGGIARRDKKDTPWALEQKTTVDYKRAYPNQSAHELVDNTRGELNNALGTLVMGDEYRKQQLERFKTQKEVRASGTRPAAPPQGSSTSEQAAGGGQKSLLDMIRSNSPKDTSIPVMASSNAPSGGAGYGRRKDIPESLTAGAASAYQDSLMERYLARKAAAGK